MQLVGAAVKLNGTCSAAFGCAACMREKMLQCFVQGHALFTRQAGGNLPCPAIDYTSGFNQFMAAAFKLPNGQTVEQAFGAPFGRHLHMVTVLCVLCSPA